MRGVGEAALSPPGPEFGVSQGGQEPRPHLGPDRHVRSLAQTTDGVCG